MAACLESMYPRRAIEMRIVIVHHNSQSNVKKYSGPECPTPAPL